MLMVAEGNLSICSGATLLKASTKDAATGRALIIIALCVAATCAAVRVVTVSGVGGEGGDFLGLAPHGEGTSWGLAPHCPLTHRTLMSLGAKWSTKSSEEDIVCSCAKDISDNYSETSYTRNHVTIFMRKNWGPSEKLVMVWFHFGHPKFNFQTRHK